MNTKQHRILVFNSIYDIRTVHEGQMFQCTQCEYKATQKSNLQTHIKSIHDGQTFPCTQCDYKATFKSSLSRHIKCRHENLDIVS